MVPNIFYFHPYLGKIFHLTNIFQKGLKPPTSIILYTVRILTPPMETQTTLRSWQPWAQPVIILMQLLHDEYAFYHATMPPTQDAGINLGKTHQVLTWTSHKIPWDDCIFAYTWMVDWFLWVFHVGKKKYISYMHPMGIIRSGALFATITGWSFQLDCLHDFWGLKGEEDSKKCQALGNGPLGGGFRYFLMFILTWGRFPFWLIFFIGVKRTN